MAPRKIQGSEVVGGSLEWLRVSDLRNDDAYQRPLDRRRVKAMAADFDPDSFGAIYVSRRSTAELVIIDGQHRVACFHEMGWSDQAVPCLVFDGLSLADEARIFRIMQEGRRALKPISLFHTKVIEGDAAAVRIKAILDGFQLEVVPSSRPGALQAIRSVEAVFAHGGPEVLTETLSVLGASWGSESDALNAELIKGMGLFVVTYRKLYDRKRLIQRLGTVRPQVLIARARLSKEMNHAATSTNLTACLVATYNQGARANRLPDFIVRAGSHTEFSGRKAPSRRTAG